MGKTNTLSQYHLALVAGRFSSIGIYLQNLCQAFFQFAVPYIIVWGIYYYLVYVHFPQTQNAR